MLSNIYLIYVLFLYSNIKISLLQRASSTLVQENPSTSWSEFTTAESEQIEHMVTASSELEMCADAEEEDCNTPSCDENKEKQDKKDDVEEDKLRQNVTEMEEAKEEEEEINDDNNEDDNIESESEGKQYAYTYFLVIFSYLCAL